MKTPATPLGDTGGYGERVDNPPPLPAFILGLSVVLFMGVAE